MKRLIEPNCRAARAGALFLVAAACLLAAASCARQGRPGLPAGAAEGQAEQASSDTDPPRLTPEWEARRGGVEYRGKDLTDAMLADWKALGGLDRAPFRSGPELPPAASWAPCPEGASVGGLVLLRPAGWTVNYRVGEVPDGSGPTAQILYFDIAPPGWPKPEAHWTYLGWGILVMTRHAPAPSIEAWMEREFSDGAASMRARANGEIDGKPLYWVRSTDESNDYWAVGANVILAKDGVYTIGFDQDGGRAVFLPLREALLLR